MIFVFVHLFKISNFPAPVTTKRFKAVASVSNATDRPDDSSKDQTPELVMVCSMWVATDVTAGDADDKAVGVEYTVRLRNDNAISKSMVFKDILNKRQDKMYKYVHFVKCNAPVQGYTKKIENRSEQIKDIKCYVHNNKKRTSGRQCLEYTVCYKTTKRWGLEH